VQTLCQFIKGASNQYVEIFVLNFSGVNGLKQTIWSKSGAQKAGIVVNLSALGLGEGFCYHPGTPHGV
jgi:hypothetical protein